jgi:predicted MFS family arabinose efflux permease
MAIAAADSTKRWILPFVATLVGMMALQMSSLGFSPLLPDIQKEFGMSYSQIGLFTGMYGLIALVMSVPAGLAAKRFGERKMLSGGLIVVALGLLLLSRAPDFWVAFGGRALWLTGYRFAFVCVLTAIALTCPPSLRSFSMGILGATSSLASVFGAPFGSLSAREFGWRNGIFGFGGMAVLGAAVFWMFYRRESDAETAPMAHGIDSARHSGPNASKPRSAFRTPVVWALALLVGMVGLGQFSATFFVPSAARTVFNLDAVGAAYIISVGYIAAIVANLLFGYLMDRFNRWKVMSIMILGLMAASFAMTSQNLFLFRVSAALVLALGFSATNQVYAIGGEVMKGRETGPVMGIVGLGAGIFGYVGPQMLGSLRDWTGSFNAGWYMMTAIAAATLIEILILKRQTEATRIVVSVSQ